MKKWNATQLKYLMAAVMVLDHIPHITGIVSPLWEGIFHALTRCVGYGPEPLLPPSDTSTASHSIFS